MYPICTKTSTSRIIDKHHKTRRQFGSTLGFSVSPKDFGLHPFAAMPELKVNSLEGNVIILDLPMTETVGQVKSILLEKLPCEDPIERKICRAELFESNSLLDDSLTLTAAGLRAESEVSVVYVRNEMEAASKDDLDVDVRGSIMVNIPKTVTKLPASAFLRSCELAKVKISESVTEIGSKAFAECTSLEKVSMFDSVTAMQEKAFYRCSSLTCISIPDSVSYIGQGVFADCSSLRCITIPHAVTDIRPNSF